MSGVNIDYGVLMIDYKGYGRSEGQPTQAGLVEDIESGIDWLQLKGIDPRQVSDLWF